MVFNKYMTMSKVIFNTLGNGVRDRTSRTPLPMAHLMPRAVRKSRIHDRRDYRDFRRVP